MRRTLATAVVALLVLLVGASTASAQYVVTYQNPSAPSYNPPVYYPGYYYRYPSVNYYNGFWNGPALGFGWDPYNRVPYYYSTGYPYFYSYGTPYYAYGYGPVYQYYGPYRYYR